MIMKISLFLLGAVTGSIGIIIATVIYEDRNN